MYVELVNVLLVYDLMTKKIHDGIFVEWIKNGLVEDLYVICIPICFFIWDAIDIKITHESFENKCPIHSANIPIRILYSLRVFNKNCRLAYCDAFFSVTSASINYEIEPAWISFIIMRRNRLRRKTGFSRTIKIIIFKACIIKNTKLLLR